MLKKLLKYEFKATSRTFGGLYLGIAVAALLLGLTMRFSLPGEAMFNVETVEVSGGVQIAAVILMLVYMGLLIAAMVLTAVTIVTRFTKNLLGGEGYLMQTLPVNTKSLIASKLIVSAVWSFATMLAWVLSMLLVMALCVPGEVWNVLFGQNGMAELMRSVQQEFGIAPVWMGLGLLIAMAAGILCAILCVYAACMVGHQFKKYVVPASILAFFVLNGLQSILLGLLGIGGVELAEVTVNTSAQGGGFTAALSALPTVGQFWLDVAITTIPCLVFAALYFLLTDQLMKKRLNLE